MVKGQKMKIQNLILPARYPITLAEAKKQCEIDDADTAHDTYVSALIMAATSSAEQFLHRRLVSQTWKYYLDCWPITDFFRLPFGRLQSVASIKYINSAGNEITWDISEYIVDTESEPGEIKLGYEKVWPNAILYPVNPIKIEFTCGYYIGDTWVKETAYAENDQVMPVSGNGLVYYASTAGTTAAIEPAWPLTIGGTITDGTVIWTCIGIAVPEPIRQAIKIMIADMFEYRETEYLGTSHTKFKTIESLLFPYKLFGWII
jgi:uncharacterized phiE125 gp8 family phage protein